MKTIVFDDDPTGSQTVSNCPLLLKWDKDIIAREIENTSLLFILANTRALTAELAEDRTREICRSFLLALEEKKILIKDFFIVSRGDSTLRGHGILEPKIINEELGPFDATFHVPAFFEGGRLTLEGTHYLNGVPVHKSTYARDKIFGYSNSFLPRWIQEKSNNEILESDVCLISMEHLTAAKKSEDKMQDLISLIESFSANQIVIVDAKDRSDLDIFGTAVKSLYGRKRFLFRSAASLINSLADVRSSENIKDFSFLRLNLKNNALKRGLVVVGSHVSIANKQLDLLLKQDECKGLELPVSKISRILDGPFPESLLVDLENVIVREILNILNQNKTPVLYTSRGEISFNSDSYRMQFGLYLAALMAKIVSKTIHRLSYIISKGGITTNILLSKGLNIDSVTLKGQISPGLSLVCIPKDLLGYPLPIITFPGNLGDKTTLVKAWKIMESNSLLKEDI